MNKTELRKGDIIEYGGREYEVYAVQPTHRTYGEGAGEFFHGHKCGLTFIDEDGYEFWIPIKGVKFVRRPSGDSSEGVTYLPDENLGGVLREYREVHRRADVGDRIKTDIIQINGERYRISEREATAGEQIIATARCRLSSDNYLPGDIFTVESSGTFGADIVDLLGDENVIPHDDYLVLEPLDSPELDPDITTGNTRISELEAKVAEKETDVTGILDTLAKIGRELSNVNTDIQALNKRIEAIEAIKAIETPEVGDA